MKMQQIILIGLVVVLLPALGPAGSTSGARKPFGTYEISGKELFEGDPFLFEGPLRLFKQKATIRFDYPDTNRKTLVATLSWDKELGKNSLEAIKRGGSIRRKLTLAGKVGKSKCEGYGWIRIRRRNDGRYKITVYYNAVFTEGPLIGSRIKGGGAGIKA
ncbi:hypothetical protein LCGC14_0094900 [marine sediment metagenome]|uniref:Uncharacterized protein n=1 Tax=marine sediment metagenome TaxID=412755 RepID=A0A0F9YGN7_9ZZZZ|nr:hypothetical protein [Phycisphaerae bacterium]